MQHGIRKLKARILLVEDSPSQGKSACQTLESMGYKVQWVQKGSEALAAARTKPTPDLILLDLILGDMDGFAVCRWLKVHAETRDIPIVMLTQKSDVEDRVEGLNVGGDDYLSKPFDAQELEARILSTLRASSAREELKRRNRELETMLHSVEAMAMTDPLTGLFNRRRFNETLRREMALTRRYHNPLSCVLLDVDHFKKINDRFGHDTGDLVLKVVAMTLQEDLRQVDLAARHGGEEFILLLPHTDRHGAMIVAERVAEKLRRLELPVGDDLLEVTASFGVVTTHDGTTSTEDFVRCADEAMYQAKQAGRDRVCVYEGKLPSIGPAAQSDPRSLRGSGSPHSLAPSIPVSRSHGGARLSVGPDGRFSITPVGREEAECAAEAHRSAPRVAPPVSSPVASSSTPPSSRRRASGSERGLS